MYSQNQQQSSLLRVFESNFHEKPTFISKMTITYSIFIYRISWKSRTKALTFVSKIAIAQFFVYLYTAFLEKAEQKRQLSFQRLWLWLLETPEHNKQETT